MKKKTLLASCSLVLLVVTAESYAAKQLPVEFRNDRENHKIEIYVGEKHLTDFLYKPDMEKQVLYPLYTPSGKVVTRGYPFDPRPFERIDHLHHTGIWFNFGDVNSNDFWNNSSKADHTKGKFGTIVFREIVKESPETGELTFRADWKDADGNTLLEETATFRFGGGTNGMRTIERTTQLKAVTEATFTENKEGLIAIRVATAFEGSSTRAAERLDANAGEPAEKMVYNEGVNGKYRNAEGMSGGDVWGKRSSWVALRATLEGEVITIAIIDNKANFGYPAWSHAREYGLFATNNLGGRAVDSDAPETKLVLQPGESMTFKHLIVIGGDLTDEQISGVSWGF